MNWRSFRPFFSFGILESLQEGLAKVHFNDEHDVLEDVPLWQPYGFHAVPKKNTDVLVLGENPCVILGCESQGLQRTEEPGVVEILDEQGAHVTLLNGEVKIVGKKILVQHAQEDLAMLMKQTLDVLSSLIGQTLAPNGPVTFPADFGPKIQELKAKWG